MLQTVIVKTNVVYDEYIHGHQYLRNHTPTAIIRTTWWRKTILRNMLQIKSKLESVGIFIKRSTLTRTLYNYYFFFSTIVGKIPNIFCNERDGLNKIKFFWKSFKILCPHNTWVYNHIDLFLFTTRTSRNNVDRERLVEHMPHLVSGFWKIYSFYEPFHPAILCWIWLKKWLYKGIGIRGNPSSLILQYI